MTKPVPFHFAASSKSETERNRRKIQQVEADREEERRRAFRERRWKEKLRREATKAAQVRGVSADMYVRKIEVSHHEQHLKQAKKKREEEQIGKTVNRLYYGCEDPMSVVPAPDEHSPGKGLAASTEMPPLPPPSLSLMPGKILSFEQVVSGDHPLPPEPPSEEEDHAELSPTPGVKSNPHSGINIEEEDIVLVSPGQRERDQALLQEQQDLEATRLDSLQGLEASKQKTQELLASMRDLHSLSGSDEKDEKEEKEEEKKKREKSQQDKVNSALDRRKKEGEQRRLSRTHLSAPPSGSGASLHLWTARRRSSTHRPCCTPSPTAI